MSHHEVAAAGRHRGYLERRLRGLDRFDVARRRTKDIPAAVDPADIAVESRQSTNDGGANMTRAEDGDVEIAADDGLEQQLVVHSGLPA